MHAAEQGLLNFLDTLGLDASAIGHHVLLQNGENNTISIANRINALGQVEAWWDIPVLGPIKTIEQLTAFAKINTPRAQAQRKRFSRGYIVNRSFKTILDVKVVPLWQM